MTKKPRKVPYANGDDLLRAVEGFRSDQEPRVLERDGEEVAVLVGPNDFAVLAGEARSKKNKAKLLAMAGAWKDLDTDKMIEEIYRARHESPPSPPIDL